MNVERIREELKKAKERRAECEARVKELERKLKEAERLEIQGLVEAAKLNPDELAELLEGLGYLKKAKKKESEEDAE